ncbi:hypothetical protein RhiirA4_466191 [Rhizophagus irregularis]|uniref:Uncharacterized protein n=1 Tax=Rhizophagus irregularis TaxID=588596 RepID=A0A2I1GTK7_9GLOM|nr:hypothetical protein RhiirA4_466191 [Rhizophagus irregularis]
MSETNISCTGCGQNKHSSEFIGFRVNGAIKQYRTCNNCRTRTTQKKEKITRKRQLEDEESEMEMIKATELCDYITQFLNLHTLQMENIEDKENTVPFFFKCQVDISTLNNSEKEIADIFAEYIEEIDDFIWKNRADIPILSRYCQSFCRSFVQYYHIKKYC